MFTANDGRPGIGRFFLQVHEGKRKNLDGIELCDYNSPVLDLTKIASEIAGLGEAVRDSRATRKLRLEKALRLLKGAPGPDELTELIKSASSTWQFAHPLEDVQTREAADEAPGNYTAIAADASQAAPGRHSPLPYYVINAGRVVIRYGEGATASLDSEPALGDFSSAEEELSYLGYEVRRDAYISEERLLAEFGALAELSRKIEPPAVAMYDGSLILWYLRKQPEKRRRDVVKALTTWLDVSRDNGVIPIGYISKPGARDVIYDLALLACDREHAHCESCRAGRQRSDVPCSEIVKLHDADVFSETSESGERSAVFINRLTPVLDEYGDEDNRIAYFYLNVGTEVARVEFPRWVFDDGLINVAQSLALDQSYKGAGYPRVLALAHEYALVERKEADAFLGLLEGAALPSLISPKEFAKRRRRV